MQTLKVLNKLDTTNTVTLNENIKIKAFTVPHRDEYSETGGFKIIIKSKTYLFIPDIDKWQKWGKNIVTEVSSVDAALLDGTFYNNNDMHVSRISEVPHPFVNETMELFKNSDKKTQSKIFFIHLNHTNALLWDNKARLLIKGSGFNIAEQGQKL